jgi:hypothetical protein
MPERILNRPPQFDKETADTVTFCIIESIRRALWKAPGYPGLISPTPAAAKRGRARRRA